MNDSRSLTWYSSSSSLMLYSCCSTSILNMTIASMGFRPGLFFLGLSCTCSKIGRNYDHGTVSSNFINRVFLLSNFWYRCSSSPTFFIPWRFNPSFCSPYTLISRATCSIFRGAQNFQKGQEGVSFKLSTLREDLLKNYNWEQGLI